MVREVVLKVSEAFQQDVGYGRARIDHQTRMDLDLSIGDVIELEGTKVTAASVWRAHPSDEGKRLVRIDNLTRKNAGTGLGDRVKIRRAEVKEAREVALAPLMPEGQRIEFGMGIDVIIRKNMLRRPISKGDEIIIPGIAFFGNALPFVIVDSNPHGIVMITERTVLHVKEEAAKIAEEEGPRVSYEDIGGLHIEIQKVREMIELPLKHPELFDRLGIDPPKGVLLHGPPGTGKTLIAKAVANESGANFYTINGPEIMCVDGATKILTNPHGFVAAKDIFDTPGAHLGQGSTETVLLSEPVSTYSYHNGKIDKARITHVTRLTVPTYHMRLSDGNSLRVSKNQPFLVYENGSLVWRPVSHLRKGQYVARVNELALPEHSAAFNLEKIPDLVEKEGKFCVKSRNLSRSTFVSLPRTSSPALLEFLGLIVSEGHISKKGDGVTFSNTDKVLRKQFVTLLRVLFGGMKIKQYRDGRVVVYSTTLVRYLASLGFTHEHKLTIPSFFYTLPKEEVRAFLRGCFDGDGTVAMTGVYPTPKLYSVSRQFLQEIQALLQLKLGMSSKVAKHPTPKGLMYEVVIRGYDGRVKFLEIGSRCARKQQRLQSIMSVKRVKDAHNVPCPSLLISEIRSALPYKRYRNKDAYVYGATNITRHALQTLYDLADHEGIVTSLVRQEYQTLMREDISWEKILSISSGGTRELYDFTVDKDSFLGGPYFLLHNSKFYGQSEENLRKVFEEAQKNAPSIIFLDEIDAIAPKRSEVHGEVERRVVSQLLTLMDGLKGRGKVIVIGATNLPDVIDPALRRPGRFDREIRIDVPDRNGRKEILQIHTRGMPINPSLAELYPGEKINEEKISTALKQGIKKIHISDLLRTMLRSKDKNKRSEVVSNYLGVTFESIKTEMPSVFFEKVIRLIADEITNLLPYDLDDPESAVSAEQQINERLAAIRENPDDFIRRITKESVLDDIADITYGFVGADLAALAREAAMNALRRYLPEIDLEKPIPVELLEKMEVTMEDFKSAHRGIEPSALREFFVEIPKVSWDDVGGLEDVKQSLKEAVEWPLTQPEVFKRMGIHAPRGILLYGPPGTGKTLLAKAVAHESKANFISIKGPEVLSKWVGESEKAVRELFKKARQVAPTIVFLDEIDSIAPRRGAFEGSHVTESVVNQLLTSIDGLESMEGVVVIGATNRPDIIDPGLLRPGRFDRLLLIPAPDVVSRLAIFKIHTKDMPLAKDVSLEELAEKTVGYSGADIDAMCREAAMLALRSDINAKEVRMAHFDAAMSEARGSLTDEIIKYYKKVKEDMSSSIAKKDKKERDIQYM